MCMWDLCYKGQAILDAYWPIRVNIRYFGPAPCRGRGWTGAVLAWRRRRRWGTRIRGGLPQKVWNLRNSCRNRETGIEGDPGLRIDVVQSKRPGAFILLQDGRRALFFVSVAVVFRPSDRGSSNCRGVRVPSGRLPRSYDRGEVYPSGRGLRYIFRRFRSILSLPIHGVCRGVWGV